MSEKNTSIVDRRVDATRLIYRDAWAFLRKAERAAEERHDVKRDSYSRAAIINAAIAGEAFINYQLDGLAFDETVDIQVEQQLALLFETPAASAAPAAAECRQLREQINAVRSLRRSKALQSKTRDLGAIERVLWRQALEIGLDYCGAQFPNGSPTRRQLSILRHEIEKREIKEGSVRTKWTRGLEHLTLRQFQPDDPIVVRFFELVSETRGKRVHERPRRMMLNAEGQEESLFLHEVSLENALIACDTVRSVIAGFYVAAYQPVPDWVGEVNDEL